MSSMQEEPPTPRKLPTRWERQSQQEAPSWQAALADAVRDPAELFQMLGLNPEDVPDAEAGSRDFPLLVPRGFIARMEAGNPHDPLLLQVVPQGRENQIVPGFYTDPLAEAGAMTAPGILQKYHGRMLMVATGACAVHCRYCFRRHFPYAEANPARESWAPALEVLASDPEIEEVILSGGDPLILSDDRLTRLTTAFGAIPHLRRLRIHSRLPIVLPERVDEGLLAWLRALPDAGISRTVLVVHANHPREIDGSVLEALVRLRETGVTLLNQSVLLAGINDNGSVLAALSETLFEAGVLPYYLHLPDPVQGTAHFTVDTARARCIQAELRTRLPGYLVPRFVREVSGAPSKLPL